MGTVSLGVFGTEHTDEEPLDLSFEWFEHTGNDSIRVDPAFSELDLMEFMAAAGEFDEDDSAAIPALMTMLRACIDPSDWKRFWATARKHRQKTGDFMALVYRIIEVATEDRPTVRPADSSAGPSTTGDSSTRALPSADDRAFEMLKDRGDLGAFVLLRREFEDSQVAATG